MGIPWRDGGDPPVRVASRRPTSWPRFGPADTSQPDAVAVLAERMVDLTRRSVLFTIDQAVDADGSQRHIDRAVTFLERGDDKRAAGKLEVADAAWDYATSAF